MKSKVFGGDSVITVHNTSYGKVMFSQVSVILSTGRCMHGKGRSMQSRVKGGVWQKGTCMVKGEHAK